MTTQIQRVAVLMLVLFVALFLNLNLLQLVRSDELASNPKNQRLLIQEYQSERGPILAGDREIAFSRPTQGELKYRRRYRDPGLWNHLTGYYSIVLGRSGLEAAMNEQLNGGSSEALARNLAQLLGTRDETGNSVRVTAEPAVQRAAVEALDGRVGAVVALDPTTGAVLGMASNPGFNTNRLASHDRSAILDYWTRLQQPQAGRPALNRAIDETYPPGSVFKVVVAAAALEQGLSPDTALEDGATFQPEVGQPIRNYGGGSCGGSTISLADALRISCNTAFAALGTQLGADVLARQTAAFGFGEQPPLELDVEPSHFPEPADAAALAQASIGQRDVRVTPLQMAMISAAVANQGVLMQPRLVAEVLDPAGRTIRGPQVSEWSVPGGNARAVSQHTAQLLGEMMVSVVDGGTGTAARIGGVRVGGKTGTAQTSEDRPPTVWFTGFAEDEVAVAVVLPDAGEGATGGGEAAPIARAVMQAALGGG